MKTKIYTVVCSDICSSSLVAEKQFGTEFEVLNYRPFELSTSLLKVVRRIYSWAKENNTYPFLQRRVTSKKIISILIKSEKSFGGPCIATYMFIHKGDTIKRLEGKEIWFAIYVNTI